jgi:hypothetical protein
MQGCFALILALFLLIVCVGFAVAAGFTGGSAFFIGLLLLGVLIAWAVWQNQFEEEAKQKLRQKTKEQIADSNFNASHSYVTSSGMAFIAVDEERMLVKVGGFENASKAIKSEVFSIRDILGVQVMENGHGVLGSDLANSLGLATAGGIVFGGTGAIVGAIAGQSAKRISDVSVVLAIDNVKVPYVKVNFIESGTNRNSDQHLKALGAAQQWRGTIEVLLNRYRRQQLKGEIP